GRPYPGGSGRKGLNAHAEDSLRPVTDRDGDGAVDGAGDAADLVEHTSEGVAGVAVNVPLAGGAQRPVPLAAPVEVDRANLLQQQRFLAAEPVALGDEVGDGLDEFDVEPAGVG